MHTDARVRAAVREVSAGSTVVIVSQRISTVAEADQLTATAAAHGTSQRRTRGWARFQCAAYRRWDPEVLVPLLAEPRPAVEDLAAAVLELDTPTADLRAALEAALP